MNFHAYWLAGSTLGTDVCHYVRVRTVQGQQDGPSNDNNQRLVILCVRKINVLEIKCTWAPNILGTWSI